MNEAEMAEIKRQINRETNPVFRALLHEMLVMAMQPRLVMSPMSGGYYAVERITGTETELVEAWISKERAIELTG